MRTNPVIYSGHRLFDQLERRNTATEVVVKINGKPLDIKPSQQLRCHSEEFNWGYSGSGPAQLALAILLDFAGPEVAQMRYQPFKFHFVSGWGDDWQITGDEIQQWLVMQEERVPTRQGA